MEIFSRKGRSAVKTVGIICEYNPLHLGHQKQLNTIRGLYGQDTAIVCLMSGNYVQRGTPAIFDKTLRAKAAIFSGADLVLELPVTYALSSAEGFAAGGVKILSDCCDALCFGTETADRDTLLSAAKGLLSADFPPLLQAQLETGVSFPAARQTALEKMGVDSGLLSNPNNILAVEYCKAILSQNASLHPLPIHRGGNYHDLNADPENPSATALRQLLLKGQSWEAYVPAEAVEVFRNASIHSLHVGERAILAKLRTMADDEFAALPYGSEGLWRKFMHACRSQATLEEVLAATKSKRYTRTRLDRMVMCAFLGITEVQLHSPAPYTRVLAFNDRGREILSRVKKSGQFVNAGEAVQHPYWELEQRCGDLYGLFSDAVEAPGAESRQRVFYQK